MPLAPMTLAVVRAWPEKLYEARRHVAKRQVRWPRGPPAAKLWEAGPLANSALLEVIMLVGLAPTFRCPAKARCFASRAWAPAREVTTNLHGMAAHLGCTGTYGRLESCRNSDCSGIDRSGKPCLRNSERPPAKMAHLKTTYPNQLGSCPSSICQGNDHSVEPWWHGTEATPAWRPPMPRL